MTNAPQILFPKSGERVDGFGPGQYFGLRMPPPPLPKAPAPALGLEHGAPVTLEQAKALHVKTVLDALEWSMTEASKVLEVDRRTLYRLCKRWGLCRP